MLWVDQPWGNRKALKPDAESNSKASTSRMEVRWKSGWAGFRSRLPSFGTKEEATSWRIMYGKSD
jgi:hypothetical protein